MTNSHLEQLVALTQTLGKPKNNYVIIGEGNTSCRVDDDTFLIKASGQGMNGIEPTGFVEVQLAPILAMIENPPGDLSMQKRVMQAAKVDPNAPGLPSVEVTFHALLLAECGVKWIGHTHPITVNQIMCSNRAQQFAENRLFPDEAVLCGPESAFVTYQDPSLPLALGIRDAARVYMDKQGEAPKVILLKNHGLIALGQTPTEVLNITAMCVKAAAIFVGACALGEPVFMSRADVDHIYKRPDEIYRRKMFVEGSGKES